MIEECPKCYNMWRNCVCGTNKEIIDTSVYESKLKKFLIPILRKKSLYWTARNDCKKEARRARGFYECASCSELFSSKEVHVDHREAVVSTKEGWVDWDTFIKRLYVPVEKLQILCISCHSAKSAIENQIRSINKKKSKKKIAKGK